jgi:hypothetical protein
MFLHLVTETNEDESVTVLCEVFAKESDDEGDGGHEEGHGHAS